MHKGLGHEFPVRIIVMRMFGAKVNDDRKGSKGDSMLTKEMTEELITGLCSIFNKQIKQIILYGSVARNDAMPESDIDIAVILDGDITEDMREPFLSFCAELDLKYDRVFSVIDINQKLMEKWRDIVPFYKNIQKEGIVLWKAA